MTEFIFCYATIIQISNQHQLYITRDTKEMHICCVYKLYICDVSTFSHRLDQIHFIFTGSSYRLLWQHMQSCGENVFSTHIIDKANCKAIVGR